VTKRYSSWDKGLGKRIEKGRATFADCEARALALGDLDIQESGRQELLEAIFNDCL